MKLPARIPTRSMIANRLVRGRCPRWATTDTCDDFHTDTDGARSFVTGAQPAGLTRSSPRTRWCTAGRCCTPSDRHSASATAPGSPTGEAGDAAGARDQFAALLPIHKRVSGPGDPGTRRAHASLVHWTGQAGEANSRTFSAQAGPSDSRSLLIVKRRTSCHGGDRRII